MKKAFFLLPVLVTSFLFFITLPAFAEVRSGAFTVSPFIGGYSIDSESNMRTDIAAGLRLGYNLSKHWSIESEFTYAPTESRKKNQDGDLIAVQGDLLYHFMPGNRFVPFVLVGGGWSKTNRPTDNEDGTLNYGIGAQYFVNDWLALRGDARKIDSFHSSGYWQNYEYTVGLSFQFGGAKTAAVAVMAKAPETQAQAPAAETAAPVPPTAAKQAPELEEGQTILLAKKTTGASGDKPELIALELQSNALEIIASERFTYQIYTLAGPARLAIDIPNMVNGLGVETVPVNRLGIASVRIGSHGDFIRVVLDAAQGILLPYRVEETGRGLKIIMKAAEKK